MPALLAARGEGSPGQMRRWKRIWRCSDTAPDTHIARKLGAAEARSSRERAREVQARGGPVRRRGERHWPALDTELRDPRNRRNPGTTADLTCAALVRRYT